MKRLLAVAIVLALGATGAVAAIAATAPTKPATVKTRSVSLGKILVNGSSQTLYLFEKDKNGKSACSGACATNWPPLLTKGKPKASGGVKSSLLGTTKRGDGSREVTYAGHPLYTFAGDTRAGQTTGQGSNGFGAPWWVVTPAGKALEK